MVCRWWDLRQGSGLHHLAGSLLEDEMFNSLKQILIKSFTICKAEAKEIEVILLDAQVRHVNFLTYKFYFINLYL